MLDIWESFGVHSRMCDLLSIIHTLSEKVNAKSNSWVDNMMDLLKQLEIDVNRKDVKLDNLLNTLSEIGRVYCPVYNNGVKTASSHWINLVNTAKTKYNDYTQNIEIIFFMVFLLKAAANAGGSGSENAHNCGVKKISVCN